MKGKKITIHIPKSGADKTHRTWGIKPVTRVKHSKKAYNRKRDKKIDFMQL